MWLPSVAILAASASVHSVTAQNTGLKSQLSSPRVGLSPGTQVFVPSDPNWTDETQRWTIHDPPTYFVAVKPALESDVQKLVRFAFSRNLSFLAIGGGHGFSTKLGALRNGLDIDLSGFRNVSVNARESTLTVGGGVRFGDIFEPVYAAGKEITTGASSCVGMLGATLGGGVGRYDGLHGLVLDSLLSVRMVTAKGDIVTASTCKNPDLFWSLRGAGFNYGIVTEATFRMHDLTSNLVVNADMFFPVNASSAIIQYLSSFGDQMPPKLAITLLASWSANYGSAGVTLNAVYAGPASELKTLLQPLVDDHPPLVQNTSIIPWKDIADKSLFRNEGSSSLACRKGLSRNNYGIGIKKYDIATFESYFQDLQSFYAKYPGARGSSLLLEAYSKKAVLAVPDNATAYPYRDVTAHMVWYYVYNDTSLEKPVNAFARKMRSAFQATGGFDPPQVYVNYGHGDESPGTLYAERKLPKLREIKKIWDPQNLFRFYAPLH